MQTTDVNDMQTDEMSVMSDPAEDLVLEEAAPQPSPYMGASGGTDLERPTPDQVQPAWNSVSDLLAFAPESAGIRVDPANASLYRVIKRHTGQKIVQNGVVYNAVTQERRRVGLSMAAARQINGDYWSPSHGWYRGGIKREQEHPTNLGYNAVQQVHELEEASPQEQAAYAAAQARLINPELLAAAADKIAARPAPAPVPAQNETPATVRPQGRKAA